MSEKGSALMLPAILIFILSVTAIVSDLGLAFAGRKYVQTVAEAASLAGAMSAELQVETIITPDPLEITYEYYARIVPEEAELAATAMVNRHPASYGVIIKSVSHYFYTEDKTRYTLQEALLRDDLVFVEHEIVIAAEQGTLLSAVLGGVRVIEAGNISRAKMEFTG